jgi:hypothetical protein
LLLLEKAREKMARKNGAKKWREKDVMERARFDGLKYGRRNRIAVIRN